MFRARNRRMERIPGKEPTGPSRRVSDVELFKMAGVVPKVVQRVN
jgi:hypothetical protein